MILSPSQSGQTGAIPSAREAAAEPHGFPAAPATDLSQWQPHPTAQSSGRRCRISDQELEKAIRRILAVHDPLPPWLSQAHWDEDYYYLEAARIAAAFPAAGSEHDLRRIVREVFEQTLPGMLEYARRTDGRLDERLDAVARDIWVRKPTTST